MLGTRRKDYFALALLWLMTGMAGAAFLIAVSLAVYPRQDDPITNHADKAQKETEQVNSADASDRLTFYTFWLMVFTGGLVGVGALQIWLLFKSDATARLTAKNGVRQTVISRRLMAISGKQTDIQIAQKEIQREEFLIRNRPHIQLRSVTFFPSDNKSEFIAILSNTGATNATVHATKMEVTIFDGQGALTPLIVGEFETEKRSLKPGESLRISRSIDEESTPLEKASRKILVTGAVVYVDGLGMGRGTSFARQNIPPSIRMNSTELVEDMNWED